MPALFTLSSSSMRRLLLMFLLLGPGLAHAGELPETDWLDLMPLSDQKALEQMPEIDHNSPEAQGTFTDKGGLKQSKGLPAVMYSTKTVAAMNGKNIRIGGYPVPLETDAKGRSTLFSWCRTQARASTCRHRRRTNWCWCVTPRG